MQNISNDINSRLPFEGAYALTEITELSGHILKELDKAEKQELEAITNLRRQREYATSRHTLKKLARSIDIGALEILKDDLGKPYGQSGSETYFVSIAHTDHTVVCGISSESAIGIDLEPANRQVPGKLKRRILHPDEAALFANMETIRLWTIKEAYIKLRGQGLRLNMNQVRIEQNGDEYVVELNNDKRAKICSFQLGKNWLAVAYFSN